MSRGLADTSVFIARESGRPIDVALLPDELGVSVVTIGELRVGSLRPAMSRLVIGAWRHWLRPSPCSRW